MVMSGPVMDGPVMGTAAATRRIIEAFALLAELQARSSLIPSVVTRGEVVQSAASGPGMASRLTREIESPGLAAAATSPEAELLGQVAMPGSPLGSDLRLDPIDPAADGSIYAQGLGLAAYQDALMAELTRSLGIPAHLISADAGPSTVVLESRVVASSQSVELRGERALAIPAVIEGSPLAVQGRADVRISGQVVVAAESLSGEVSDLAWSVGTGWLHLAEPLPSDQGLEAGSFAVDQVLDLQVLDDWVVFHGIGGPDVRRVVLVPLSIDCSLVGVEPHSGAGLAGSAMLGVLDSRPLERASGVLVSPAAIGVGLLGDPAELGVGATGDLAGLPVSAEALVRFSVGRDVLGVPLLEAARLWPLRAVPGVAVSLDSQATSQGQTASSLASRFVGELGMSQVGELVELPGQTGVAIAGEVFLVDIVSDGELVGGAEVGTVPLVAELGSGGRLVGDAIAELGALRLAAGLPERDARTGGAMLPATMVSGGLLRDHAWELDLWIPLEQLAAVEPLRGGLLTLVRSIDLAGLAAEARLVKPKRVGITVPLPVDAAYKLWDARRLYQVQGGRRLYQAWDARRLYTLEQRRRLYRLWRDQA